MKWILKMIFFVVMFFITISNLFKYIFTNYTSEQIETAMNRIHIPVSIGTVNSLLTICIIASLATSILAYHISKKIFHTIKNKLYSHE